MLNFPSLSNNEGSRNYRHGVIGRRLTLGLSGSDTNSGGWPSDRSVANKIRKHLCSGEVEPKFKTKIARHRHSGRYLADAAMNTTATTK